MAFQQIVSVGDWPEDEEDTQPMQDDEPASGETSVAPSAIPTATIPVPAAVPAAAAALTTPTPVIRAPPMKKKKKELPLRQSSNLDKKLFDFLSKPSAPAGSTPSTLCRHPGCECGLTHAELCNLALNLSWKEGSLIFYSQCDHKMILHQ